MKLSTNKEPAKFIKKLEAAEKAAKDGQKPAAAEQDHSQHQH
jgi:hypothetical protein